MRIVYGDTSVLFTGDAERDAEHEMVEGMAFFVVAKIEVINYIENLT